MPRKRSQRKKLLSLPLLPLKDAVVFPNMVVPLLVGRSASVEAVECAVSLETPIFLCTQNDPTIEEPVADNMNKIGVMANLLQTLRMPDGTMKVVVEGIQRAEWAVLEFTGYCYDAQVTPIEPIPVKEAEIEGQLRLCKNLFEEYVRLSQRIAPEIVMTIQAYREPEMLTDIICGYLPIPVEERQVLLETLCIKMRLEEVITILMRENEMTKIEHSVRNRVREQMERGQREHFLQEQLKVIHQELGNREEGMDEYSELREMVEKAKMPKEVREKAEREVVRYERMPFLSPESAIIRNYIEWLSDVPWSKRTKDTLDLVRAQSVLDEDHYGLVKVKERILEFLAVRKLRPRAKGPILCLVGPPGVGKTSLGQSIARSMNRKFVRVSLGGVRDEAEIRGHRRTYIGSMPGRIIQSMKKVGVRNPVFMLDEIDKMMADFRGDPASALLEVLDPAQNKAFSDHFLEVDFDLSEVFFIATANTEANIPYALHDRMEVVRLSSYTPMEKREIARQFLIPRQIEETGLSSEKLSFEETGIETLIRRYTHEAGVRELERQIATICRKVARKVLSDDKVKTPILINTQSTLELLGPPSYTDNKKHVQANVGTAIGLAYTSVGGDTLTIETSTMKGKGKLILTGQLGDVMKESAEAGYTYLRAHEAQLELPEQFHKELDLHVHVPEGATPKDGPSAGVAILVSMLSALKNEAPRPAIAMTGEITLRGRVLPVGGIKEKTLAAFRDGISTVILPAENEKDLIDIPEEVKSALEFVFIDNIETALLMVFEEVKAPA